MYSKAFLKIILLFFLIYISYFIFAIPISLEATNMNATQTYIENEPTNIKPIFIGNYDLKIKVRMTLSDVDSGNLSTPSVSGVTPVFENGTLIVKGKANVLNQFFSSPIVFTPNTNYNKDFKIYITLSSKRQTIFGEKSLKCIPVNDILTAEGMDISQVFILNTSINISPITVFDADIEQTITVTLTLSNPLAGDLSTSTSGSTTSTFNSETGVWRASGSLNDVNELLSAPIIFTPTNNFTSDFTIEVSITDGYSTITGEKSIIYNSPPEATNIDAPEFYREVEIPIAVIVILDVVVSDIFTVTMTLSNPLAGVLSTGSAGDSSSEFDPETGIWECSGNITDVNTILSDTLSFTPETNFTSDFTIEVSITDGYSTITGEKNITYVNPPQITGNTSENYTVDVAKSLDDIIVSDSDSDELTVTLAFPSAAGSINTATSGDITSEFSAGVWSASGLITDLNILLSNLTFTPSSGYSSQFNIFITVEDEYGSVTATKPMTGIMILQASQLSTEEEYVQNVTKNLTPIVITGNTNVTARLTLSDLSAGNLSVVAAGDPLVTPTFSAGVWTATGSISSVNACLNILQFVPSNNYNSFFTIATTVFDTATTLTGSKSIITFSDTFVRYTAFDVLGTGISPSNNANVTSWTNKSSSQGQNMTLVQNSTAPLYRNNAFSTNKPGVHFLGSGYNLVSTSASGLALDATCTICVYFKSGGAQDTLLLSSRTNSSGRHQIIRFTNNDGRNRIQCFNGNTNGITSGVKFDVPVNSNGIYNVILRITDENVGSDSMKKLAKLRVNGADCSIDLTGGGNPINYVNTEIMSFGAVGSLGTDVKFFNGHIGYITITGPILFLVIR